MVKINQSFLKKSDWWSVRNGVGGGRGKGEEEFKFV
jgi:hypothetical protein